MSECSKAAAVVAATLETTTAVKLAPPEVCEHDSAAITCPAPREEPADIRESSAESPMLRKPAIESGPSAAPLPPFAPQSRQQIFAQPQFYDEEAVFFAQRATMPRMSVALMHHILSRRPVAEPAPVPVRPGG